MGNQNDVPKILKDLKKINLKKKIKIRYKKLSSGFYSLYFDMWHNGKRQYEWPKIYVKGNRNNSNTDKNNLKIAISIRDKKELELLEQDTGFELTSWKAKANFVEYFGQLSKKKRAGYWSSLYKYLKRYTDGNISIQLVNRKFCESFKDYLLKNLSSNSANVYFSIFKSSLNGLVRDDILKKNPAYGLSVKKVERRREFLTEDELKKVKGTKFKDENLKNAFLFSCFTGLRLSDIRKLTFDQITDGMLAYKQTKTKSHERIKLNQSANDILSEQRELSKGGKVFNLKTNRYISASTKCLMKESGIKKHITFHCARHTFATLCLTYDIDLYTVSKLLGHKDIQSTQIYAKLIDKKKDEAVDKLPRI